MAHPAIVKQANELLRAVTRRKLVIKQIKMLDWYDDLFDAVADNNESDVWTTTKLNDIIFDRKDL